MESIEEKKSFYFKFFIVCIVLNFLISDIGFLLNYSVIPGITFIPKACSVILFACSFMYIIITGKIKMVSQSYVLITFAMIALLVGSMKNGINTGTFSHIYSFIMPISVCSFGYYYAKEYNRSKGLRKIMDSSFKFLAISEFLLTVMYHLLRNGGMFYANSFGAGGLIFSSLYYLANGNYKMFIFSLIGVILSNKRSSLLIIGIGVLYYLSRGSISKKVKNIGVAGILFFLLLFVYNYTNYLDRFNVLFQIDFSNINSIHIATSYRTLEIEYVVNFLKESVNNFIFGGGFGSEIFNGFQYVRYIHFGPANYAFISGVPFAILMYLFFLIDTIKIRKKKSRDLLWIDVSWVAYFALSFTAATFSTHILTWFILGGLKYSNGKEISNNDMPNS